MRGREVRQVRNRRRICKLAPKTDKPFVVFVDGQPVLRQDWERSVGGDQVVVIFMLPQGGGGSNPLRIIGMLAIVAASFVLGPEIGAFLGPGIFGSGVFGLSAAAWTSIASAGIMFGGSMLLNAVVPPPALSGSSMGANVPAASPTYALQAQGNAARLGQPIPVQYGRLRVYPDFAAQPYVEYANNEQYLYQLLCIGQGHYDIEELQINDSPFSSFKEVTYEVVLPGAKPTLFPVNVTQSSEVSGQELVDSSHPIGPFVANPAGTVCQMIGIDIVAPRGMYYANDGGGLDSRTAQFKVEVRLIDQTGSAIGLWTAVTAETGYTDWSAWVSISSDSNPLPPPPANTDTIQYQSGRYTLNDEGIRYFITRRTRTKISVDYITISGSTTTPIRKSYKFDVSAFGGGQTYPRFQVRCTRTDTKDTSTRAGDEIDWAGLRCYMPSTSSYGNVTMLAVRAQATNNLSSMSARQINVIATRKLQAVTSTGLSSTLSATRSVAAALADIAMNNVYGGGIPSANIDWTALYALDQTLTARGDYLDLRFDSSTTLWEALTQAGVVARTKPFMQGGVMHFLRDQAQSVPVALFSMRNIVQNSMSINYLTPTAETSDSVQVTYFDKTTWQQTTVDCVMAGGTSNNPAKISLLGITERAQAFREGIYQSAANKYRRKVIKFSTEAEGFIPAFGDLIAIAHDIPAWGQTAEVTGWDAGTLTLTVNETLDWSAGSTFYVGLRKRDGSIAGPFTATQGAAANILVLGSSPGFTPYTGADEERTHIAFGPGEAWRQPARVVSVQPRGPYQVEITAINEDGSVHTAETGMVAPALVYSQLPKTASLPAVTGLAVVIDVTGATPQYVATWNAAAGADHYVVEISWDGGSTWSPLTTEFSTQHRWAANRNASASVRVAAVNIGQGAWATASVNYSSAPAAPTGLAATINADTLALTWAANTELDVVGYEVRTSDSGWGTAGAVFSGNALSCTTATPSASSATTYYLRAIDFLGNYSASSASVTFTVAPPSAVSGLTAAVAGTQLSVSWSKPASIISTQVSVAQFEVRTADTGWGTSSGYVFKGDALAFLTAPPAAGASVTYYARAIDVRGNYSSTSASVTFTSSPVTNIASFSWSFYPASATSANVTLSWTNVAPQFGLGYYQVVYGSVTKTTKSNSIVLPADWIGDRSFTIQTVDALGNVSSGYTASVTKQAPNTPTGFRANVVDNNVMLYWTQPALTTLPISHYEIRRGASWAGYDVDFGRKDGVFTTINETYGGAYTYWIAAIDTDGNYSLPANVSAQVSQPPDFVFYGQQTSTLSGTKSSAFLEAGAVLLPVNTTETWATHFTSRSWSTPQDQINAGYPVFIQPSSSPGYYEETFDFGTVIPSSRVTLAYTASVVAGAPVMGVTISTSPDGSTWTATTGNTQIYSINFRYVKIRLTATDSAGTGVFALSSLNVTLDAKQIGDAGSTACAAGDASGSVANFAREFVDVSSITITPSATSPVTAVYDFLDSIIVGTYSVTSNVCTVTATGHSLVAGQKVRLSFTTGTAPNGVYTVASVINANSYTVALTTGNTSGNVSTYPQGMRIYLFNNSGTRVSGTASWSIKGY